MAAYVFTRRLVPGLLDVRAVALLLVVGVWLVAVVGGFVGLELPFRVPFLGMLLFAVPLALGAVALFGRGRASPAVRLAASGTGLAAAAIVASVMISVQPVLAVVIPGLAVSALACARYPAAAVIGAFVLTGSFNTLEALTPLPVGESVDILLAGLWTGTVWMYLVKRRARPVWLWPGVVASGLYLLATALAVVGADSLIAGLYAFRVSAWYMAAFLLIGYAGWRAETYRRVAYGFVAAAALVGGYATFRWIVGPAAAEQELALSVAPEYNFVNDELRLLGSFPTGKDLAAWTASAIPFCLAFALTFRTRWRLVALAACVVCGIGLFGSEARAGFLGAVVGVALVLLLYQFARAVPGLHLGVTAIALIGVLAVGAVSFAGTAGSDEASSSRYTTLLTPGEDPAYQARVFKWRTALDDIRAHPLGQGLGTSGQAQERYGRFSNIGSVNIDNSYLKIALDQGFAVMLLFIASVVLILFGLGRRALFAVDARKAGLAIGACGALASFAVLMFSGVFIEGLPALTVWMLVGLGVSQFVSPPSEQSGTAS